MKPTLALAALLVSLSLPASAQQLAPYCPPGQDVGYAPADHPLVQQYRCSPYDTRVDWPDPPPPASVEPDPTQPWTLAPDQPMEVGHVYRNPYGLVYSVVGVQGPSVPNGSMFSVPLGWLIVLHYQSESEYRRGQVSAVFGIPADAPRGVKWEIAR